MKHAALKFIYVLALMGSGLIAKAQYVTDLTGKPLLERKYTDVQGTPYLSDSWLNGTVKLNSGTLYKGVKLKYNQVDDLPLFQDQAGQVMYFADAVSEFTLDDGLNKKTFRNGFKSADDHISVSTFFQVLADEETPLVKKSWKKAYEYKEFNSATATKKFQETQTFYLVKNGLAIKIKRDKKSVLDAFGDRKTELEAFVKSNDINLKSDDDLIKLTTYYNSLK